MLIQKTKKSIYNGAHTAFNNQYGFSILIGNTMCLLVITVKHYEFGVCETTYAHQFLPMLVS